MLEEDGIISSHSGAISTVVIDHGQIGQIRTELLEGGAKTAVDAMKRMGVTLEEALALIERLW